MLWRGIEVNVGDVMCTECGCQFFYVFEIKDNKLLTQGISTLGSIFNNDYNWSFARKCNERGERKFYDLLERYNCVIDVNLKKIRRKYNH